MPKFDRLYYVIYETTNKINGRKYIGMHQTNNLDDNYLGSGLRLIRSIQKYGRENFTKQILYTYRTYEEMVRKEKELITDEIVNSPNYYNLRTGGQGGRNSDISKQKIGEKTRLRWKQYTEEQRDQIRNKTLKSYTSDRRSKIFSGEKNGMWNKKHSVETKKLISENSRIINREKYHWMNNDGREFKGLISEFYKEYGLCRGWVSRVVTGYKKSIKGWKCQGLCDD